MGLFTMDCLRNFGSCTYFTDTASVTEVFVPVVGAIYVLFWVAMLWWYKRKNETWYKAGTPRWLVAYSMLTIPAIGLLAIVFAAWAFMPGNLW
ncbi:hypothetical protein [Kocuria rosea]|uniref:hypothetical protein n=1 Tax=Kocuria rosea TaxID=1275 RepID=UPI0011A0E730|nr:hypothetical protein [Kocuria rosea]